MWGYPFLIAGIVWNPWPLHLGSASPIFKPFLKNALENAELRDRGYSLVVTCLPSMHRALGLVLSTHEPGMVVHFYKSSPGEAGPGRSQVKAILRNTEV